MVCLFDTELGRMAVVLVGAMIVAGIETVATGKVKPSGRIELQHHELKLEKGAELGRFYLGSTAIILFEKIKSSGKSVLKPSPLLSWANVWAIRFNPSIDLKESICSLFIFYGWVFLCLKSRFSGNSHLCWYVCSFICLLLGSLYAIGDIFL